MYDFKKVEGEIAEFWKKKKIEEKARKRSQKNKETYFLSDGPPYANGHIHMGHALNKTLKDIALRSKRMQGLNVSDIPGYDTHGVPIEFQVEKQIGIKNKQDIETYGVKKFIDQCKNFVEGYVKTMNKEFSDLGVWMDWKKPYVTFTNEYIETIWWTFKKAHEKDLLYLGKYPVHVCPRCETAVAYNEIEHQKLDDPAIYVKFPMEERGKYLVIFTTTPWTLPGNSAVMVNPEFEYAEVQVGNETWIIAKELVENLMFEFNGKTVYASNDKLINQDIKNYKIKRTFKGKELEGRKYTNPLAKNLKVKTKNAYKVILSPRYVTLEAGTGLVHCSPGHGKEDYDASRKYDIDVISPIAMNGNLTAEAGKYAGKRARVVDEEIIADLEKDGFLVFKQRFSHDYPICWRCKTPLLMMSVPQWFFRISKIHLKLMEENAKVNWVPYWAKERMNAWLEGISDWPISRQRYWGTPLPIWTCDKCDHKIVVGSMDELKKLSGKKVKDLHKPEIDEVTIKCKECNKGTMKRVTEVLDVWFDSGVASWAALNFPRDEKQLKKFWPANFNIEGTDQFRGWWNSQLILSVMAFDKKPFENIYVHGMILDLGKKKMSKSMGNVVSPQDVIERFGRDALRYYVSTINPGENLAWNEDYFKEVNKFFNVLTNISNLVDNEYGLKFTQKSKAKEIEDKWIISKLNNLIEQAAENYNKYFFYKNTELISKFLLEDVSRKYIQLVRERINQGDKAVGETLNHILSTCLLFLAPIIPFATEHLYKKMKGKEESIHFYNLPKADPKSVDEKLENEMAIVFKVMEAGLSERDRAKIGLRWPLSKATAYLPTINWMKKFEEIIERQLNVKKVDFKIDTLRFEENRYIDLDTALTPELESEGYARELARFIQDCRKKLGLQKKDRVQTKIFVEDDLLKMLEKQQNFLRERTNSSSLKILLNVTTDKERFKNKIPFTIKDKRGEVEIITTSK